MSIENVLWIFLWCLVAALAGRFIASRLKHAIRKNNSWWMW